MRKIISLFLIIFGIYCYIFAGYGFIERTKPTRISFADSHQVTANLTSKKIANPTSIEIPSLKIVLPIIQSKIINNEWEATTEGVSYLIHSPVPGETGNSILYGHNWPNLLGKLPKIKIGEEIIITSEDNKKYKFDVHYTATVTPDQVSVLKQSQDKRITLYTCTGFLDSHRFVVVGILKENELFF